MLDCGFCYLSRRSAFLPHFQAARAFLRNTNAARRCLTSCMNDKAEALKQADSRILHAGDSILPRRSAQTAGDSIVEQLRRFRREADSNYRAACKARSRKEFIAKIGVATEEADESLGWLQSLRDAELGDRTYFPAIKEANELTSIFVSSHKTASAPSCRSSGRQACRTQKRRQQMRPQSPIRQSQSPIDNPSIDNRQSAIVNRPSPRQQPAAQATRSTCASSRS